MGRRKTSNLNVPGSWRRHEELKLMEETQASQPVEEKGPPTQTVPVVTEEPGWDMPP